MSSVLLTLLVSLVFEDSSAEVIAGFEVGGITNESATMYLLESGFHAGTDLGRINSLLQSMDHLKVDSPFPQRRGALSEKGSQLIHFRTQRPATPAICNRVISSRFRSIQTDSWSSRKSADLLNRRWSVASVASNRGTRMTERRLSWQMGMETPAKPRNGNRYGESIRSA